MIPIRLLHQSWLAAVLLFAPWLAAFFLNAPLLRQRPVTALALLPGLAVAASVQHQLARHLRANHRPGEEDRLFPTLGAANWITLLRAAAVVSLAGLLPRALPGGNSLPEGLVWAPGVVYLGVALADLLDGMVARRRNRVTELGKRLDIATDAAGLLAASLLAVGLGRLPVVYLLVGLAYYPFVFGIWLRQKRGLPLIALQPRPYARIIAGFQMGLVAMALLPIFNPAFTFVAAWIFMTPLLAGFLRDWLVVSCRLHTDAGQKTALDRPVGILLARDLPLLLRFLVLVCGVATLAAGDVHQVPPSWQLALGLGCLLAGFAVMGRSAALLLVVLLGHYLSPFGASMSSLALFAAAAGLMLTGTGALSLWAPEEPILYRRIRAGSMACREKP
jgi:CDP-diacylglycerol--glycerol-3-phosphate 3-phosphatidyltransferase